MRRKFIALNVALFLCLLSARADDTNEALSRDLTILRQAIEEPLQIEFLHRGLTPRNAATASQYVLDELALCWSSDRSSHAEPDGEIAIISLGGKTIVTYASPCIDELVERVADLRR